MRRPFKSLPRATRASSCARQKLAASDTRVIVRTDVVPEYRVTSFSHMGMLYRPENPKYSAEGSDRICRKEGEKASGRLCLEAPEDAVFYGA